MKPLLRAVLIVDALLLIAVGGLCLLSPWRALFDALQLASIEPPMVGQALGIALVGLAWLALHAAIDGDLTTSIARAVSHVNWLTGALMLVWVIALRDPSLSGLGQLVSVVAGAALVIVGFGGARLAAAVRRRERAQALDAAKTAQVAKGVKGARGVKDAPEPALNTAPRVEPGVEPSIAPASSAAWPEPAESRVVADFDAPRSSQQN
ncbi:hypothetical protein [Burkholderia guangdongensis]|uniref:hypothetical protein n=1 Tax=Burkholderia guangdongensis TaxID=1792500 RepID=UPI0015C8FD0B|nr:hypothetical protein [Burkholderia guangdongensis]